MVYQINIVSPSIELYNLIKKDKRFNIHRVYIEKNTYNEKIHSQIEEQIIIVTNYEDFEKNILETFSVIDFKISFFFLE